MSTIKYHEIFKEIDVEYDDRVKVQLLDEDFWNEIFPQTNEIYATNMGSYLIPELRIRITGLDPFEMYAVCVEFKLLSKNRWRYANGKWVADEPLSLKNEIKIGFMHPETYQNGFGWMEKTVSFKDMRISVNEFATTASDVRDMGNIVFLHPYAKYVPVIKVFKLSDGFLLTETYSKTLEICQFITVINYQNPKMIEMKGKVAARRPEDIYLKRPEENPSSSSSKSVTFPFEKSTKDLTTYIPKTITMEDVKDVDFIWSSTLFSGTRMNFFTFVELYQIKNKISHDRYPLRTFVTEIENNSLNLPCLNLNVSGRSEESPSKDTNSPAKASPSCAEEGAVGGSGGMKELTEYDKLVKEAFMKLGSGHYIVDNAFPIEDFLDAFLIFESRLPAISEEVLEELRNLTPLHRSDK